MYNYYDKLTAVERSVNEINNRTKFLEKYTRGENDCFELARVYDEQLRGLSSIIRGLVTFDWSSPREYLSKLRSENLNPKIVLELCGYDLLDGETPEVGDVMYNRAGAYLAGPEGFWITTSEENLGVIKASPMLIIDTKLKLVGRPRKEL